MPPVLARHQQLEFDALRAAAHLLRRAGKAAPAPWPSIAGGKAADHFRVVEQMVDQVFLERPGKHDGEAAIELFHVIFLREPRRSGDTDGQQHQGEQGRGDQAADHHNGERLLDFRAGPAGEQQRHQAEGGNHRRHQHRAQTPLAPSTTTSCQRHALRPQLIEIAHHHHAVQHGDAQQGDETRPTPAPTGIRPEIHSANTPPIRANGMLVSTSTAWRTEPKVANSSRKISPSATGTTMPRRFAARCWFSNCPPHTDAVAAGQLDFRRDRLLGLLDKTDQVAAAHIGLHHHVALRVFAVDLDRAIDALRLRDLRKRHALAVRQGNAQGGKQRRRQPQISSAPRSSSGVRRPLPAPRARPLPFDAGSFSASSIGVDAQTQPPGSESVHFDLQVLHAVVLHRDRRPRARRCP